MNELNIELGVNITPAVISITGLEQIKISAEKLAKQMENVQITEDNVKAIKKLVAAVSKKVKELEDMRIGVKKTILHPYEAFETQVKEIVSIVKSADNIVRTQIRTLEDQEREQKREMIEKMFNKRLDAYDFGNIVEFGDFLKPSHLNKTTSFNKVEEECVAFLEKIDSDLNAIKSLPHASEVLAEYQITKDITSALQATNERIERMKKVDEVVNIPETSFLIRLFDEKDFKLVEMFMQQNNIEFEKVGK